MFEYINSGMLIVIIIVTFMLIMFVLLEKGSRVGNIFILLLWLTGSFYLIYDSYTTANSNIQSFKNNKVLQCTNGFNTTYRVSLKNNWELDKNYFIKDSLLIRAEKCEER